MRTISDKSSVYSFLNILTFYVDVIIKDLVFSYIYDQLIYKHKLVKNVTFVYGNILRKRDYRPCFVLMRLSWYDIIALIGKVFLKG